MNNDISVQAFATQRNGQAELLVDYLLDLTLKQLKEKGIVTQSTEPELHKPFKSIFISDIFDHYFTATLANGKIIQFWGQTTCYKGNATSAPESNKTYEIRETLIEGLGLRADLIENEIEFRTLHFTLGPTGYTYSWFPAAKDNGYDLSLYLPPTIESQDLFQYVAHLLSGVSTEFEVKQRFEAAYVADPAFKQFIAESIEPLVKWFEAELPTQDMADKQAKLLLHEQSAKSPLFDTKLKESKQGGEDIKRRSLSLLNGESEPSDKILLRTLEDLLQGNPFLKGAIEALEDWHSWFEENIPETDSSLKNYITDLWTTDLPERLIVRRLLIRLNTGEAVRYPADLEVPGVTEHNLYNGFHNETQTEAIVDKIVSRYRQLDINTPEKLRNTLSKFSTRLLKESLRLESYNGTSLKPSFLYVTNKLSEIFDVKDFRNTSLEAPIAYYSQFGEFNVSPYSNLKVIFSKKSGQPLAILKAKYFRRQEFPRRAKEESYVGLTLKYKLSEGSFMERYNLPIVMFVDMDSDLQPPEYSVLRMFTAGWDVFFKVDVLIEYLVGRDNDV